MRGNSVARNFPNFLSAYQDWAEDKFVPPQFSTFAGLSIIAGALERKVWLPWTETFNFYPNIYVILVARPGVGKSVAVGRATDVIRGMNRKTGTINIMPSQVTEAKFIELMGHGRSFTQKVGEKEIVTFQNAGYYYASEASNSLRDIFGSFIACLTDFYDCPPHWERGTKKDGKKISLQNVCVNLLAGSTFDYLGKLINDENVQGGFASRIIYVVNSENVVRHQEFQGGLSNADRVVRGKYQEALEADLAEINSIVGPVEATPEFKAAWEQWFPTSEAKRFKFNSEKIQSLLARTNTNAIKLSIILSAAESNDRILHLRHWEKAVELLEAVNAKVPTIFSEAKAAQGPGVRGNALTHKILQIARSGRKTISEVRAEMTLGCHSAHTVEAVLNSLLQQGMLIQGSAEAGKGVLVHVKEGAEADLA